MIRPSDRLQFRQTRLVYPAWAAYLFALVVFICGITTPGDLLLALIGAVIIIGSHVVPPPNEKGKE